MPGADLFVVCKKCGSEVSPYITECPYCGTRLRKRAPKLEPARPAAEAPRIPTPRLSPLRSGEIPGIRPDARPYVTIALVVASLGVSLAWKIVPSTLDIAVNGAPGDEFWRVFTAPFVYENVGYGFVALVAIAIFGWLLERRHGPSSRCSSSSAAPRAASRSPRCCPTRSARWRQRRRARAPRGWAVPSLIARRRGEDTDSDLLGASWPVRPAPPCCDRHWLARSAVREAGPLAGLAGVVVGFALGFRAGRGSAADR